jgi:hypothetical protein
MLIRGTKSATAAFPFEPITVERTLNGTTPVSLAETPGAPTPDDIFSIRSILPKAPADVVPGGVEVFITGPGSGGGVPAGDVYGHLAVMDGVTRTETHMGVAVIPGGFEAGTSGFTLGAHEDATGWLDVISPAGLKESSFHLPIKAGAERAFDVPRFAAEPAESPVRYPAGTFFRLMGSAKKTGGANTTRLGGSVSIPLFEVAT